MKKITFLISLIFTSIGYSQTNPINFEVGGNGAGWTWNTFENPTTPCPALNIFANPDVSGLNTSATVASYTPVVGAPFYAGTETALGSPLGPFTLNATNCTIKILVWKPVISNVGIKFAAFDGVNNGASTGEINVSNTLINQWEELTFNFSSKIGEASSTNINQIVIFIDSNSGRTSNNTCYFDNIRFLPQIATPTAPIVAAMTPTRPAANVISMFSNAYTNVAVDTWQTSWSSGTLTDLQIAGNDTKKYSNLDYVGITTEGSNQINATSMLYFHIDAWTPNMTTFRVKLVDYGADANYGGGDDKESEVSFTPTLNGWNSYEIPMSDFANLTTRAHISQLILSGAPAGTGIVFIDNVYFHNVPFVDPNTPMVAAPTPTTPAATVISMFSNAYTNVAVDTWRTSWSNANLTDLQIVGNDTKKYSSMDFVGIETTGANLINANTMNYFHLDVWTPNLTSFRVKLVDFGADGGYAGGDDKEHEITLIPTLSGWNSYNISMSDFTGLTTRAHIAQLILAGSPSGTGIVFIDNVYFTSTILANTSFETLNVSMYPNPASNLLNIDAKSNIENVSIYNTLGQEVLSQSVNKISTVLDITNLQTGVYVVKTAIDGKVASTRLIKN